MKRKRPGRRNKKMKFSTEAELVRATQLAVKTLQRASVQKIEDPYRQKQKLLQKLVTSGFDFSVGKKAIELAYKSE
jgi:SOS response regulatory protein OraA/RecX